MSVFAFKSTEKRPEPAPQGMGGAAGHGKYSTERCGGPKKSPEETQVPTHDPHHVCYNGENQDLLKMVGALIFTFKQRRHRERWHLVSLYARKNILKSREIFSSSENSETGLE